MTDTTQNNKREYLESINYNFYSKTAERKTIVKGIDTRDLWNLDITMIALLIERLDLYVIKTNHDLEHVRVWADGTNDTQINKINEILELSQKILKSSVDYEQTDVDKLWAKWATLSPTMWI